LTNFDIHRLQFMKSVLARLQQSLNHNAFRFLAVLRIGTVLPKILKWNIIYQFRNIVNSIVHIYFIIC